MTKDDIQLGKIYYVGWGFGEVRAAKVLGIGDTAIIIQTLNTRDGLVFTTRDYIGSLKPEQFLCEIENATIVIPGFFQRIFSGP